MELLNDAAPEDQLVRTLRRIIDNSQTLVRIAGTLHVDQAQWVLRSPRKSQRGTAKLQKLVDAICGDLDLFPSVPELALATLAKTGTLTGLCVTRTLTRDSPFYGNNTAELMLSALDNCMTDETIAKIKVCVCGRNLFQKFAHQKFCSTECRVQANQNTDAAREYRRRKQREYYHLHKRKNTK